MASGTAYEAGHERNRSTGLPGESTRLLEEGRHRSLHHNQWHADSLGHPGWMKAEVMKQREATHPPNAAKSRHHWKQVEIAQVLSLFQSSHPVHATP